MGSTNTDSTVDTIALSELPAEFQRRATLSREYAAAKGAAHAWESAARLAEASLRAHAEERLGENRAVLESGYTWSHLKRLAREGKTIIEPDGTILRKNLPRKPGHGVARKAKATRSSKEQLARAVANGG